MRRYPIPAFRHDFDAFTPEGGESQAAIRARALLALENVWRSEAARVLVVSHGGFLNTVLRELMGAHRGWFAFEDTSFATVTLSRTGVAARVTGVDLAPHLTPAGAADRG